MRIVPVSHDLAGFLATGLGLPGSALDVVHNGIPLAPVPDPSDTRERRSKARAELGLPPDGALAVAVGNLYPVKSHATLVAALAQAPGLRAAIAGRGEEEARLREQALALGVADRLHLLGLRDDIDRVLRAGDVFVHPSRLEGLPLAILEAMSAGLPVVASRVGGIPEAVVDGETGVLVPTGDPAALAGALRHVLGTPGFASALGAAGRARAERLFSVEAMVSAYRRLYGE
jgi:glycosyltransferase involved in cell wall biosynthesis